jgi:ribose transport system permease protein
VSMDTTVTNQGSVTSPSRSMRAIEGVSRYGTISALVILTVVFSVLRPDAFFQFTTAVNILDESAVLTVVAVGLTLCLAMFEFELSNGYMASFTGILVAGLMALSGLQWPVAVAAAIAVGGAVGLVNGFIVSELRVTSFIATLAMGTALIGLNFWYHGGQTIALDTSGGFIEFGQLRLFNIPLLVYVAGLVSVISWLLLNHTVLGRSMYAIGGNVEAAQLAGIAISRVRIVGFVLCGALAALGGVMITAQFGIGFPSSGDALLLQAFTANFLGSVTLRDGEFHVIGTVVGVLLLSVIFTGLTIMGAPLYTQNWIQAGLLVAAVAVSGIARRLMTGR